LSIRDLLARTGIDFVHIQRMCAALSIPVPEWDANVFTERDYEALDGAVRLVDDGALDGQTAATLLRGTSHLVERLVWWQFQALVEDTERRLGLDDKSARIVVLDRIVDWADIMEEQIVYAWRRNLATTIRWIGKRLGDALPGQPRERPLPLMRAVGFADLVGYTEVTEHLDAAGLAALVQDFESTAEGAVAQGGGRLVKTIGDAVMFTTGEPESGALIALELAETIGRDTATPPARVALAWGSVLERFGDVFGPIVNLASRMAELAEPGMVVVDDSTAAALAADSRVRALPLTTSRAEGIGEVNLYRLVRRL
jgi:adenylate cyclase